MVGYTCAPAIHTPESQQHSTSKSNYNYYEPVTAKLLHPDQQQYIPLRNLLILPTDIDNVGTCMIDHILTNEISKIS